MSGIFRKKANAMMESVQTRTELWVSWLKGTTLKVMGVFIIGTLQLWISLFLYGSFYYTYMPTVAHISPVYLQFSSCLEYGTQLNCPFPSVNTTLVKNLQEGTSLLMRGQRYQILLELEMPQSPVNENLGMFMVKADILSLGGEITASSSRPGMLRYRSRLLKIIETLFFSPFMLSGYSEEKQLVRISLMENFVDNPYKPMIGAHIQLQARQLQIYSSVLKIQAYFSGLRYLMYHWPITTALTFVTTFFVFLSLISVLSWQQCIRAFSSQEEEMVVRMDDVYSVAYEDRRKMIRTNLESERAGLFQSRGRPSHVKRVRNWEDDQESQSSGISSVGDQGLSIVETIKTTAAEGSSEGSWVVMDKQSTSISDANNRNEVATAEDKTLENDAEDAQEKVEVKVDEEVQEEAGEEEVKEKAGDEERVEEVVDGLAGAMETDVKPLVPEGEELRRRMKDPDTTHQ